MGGVARRAEVRVVGYVMLYSLASVCMLKLVVVAVLSTVADGWFAVVDVGKQQLIDATVRILPISTLCKQALRCLLAHLWPRNESLHLRLRWADDTELTASGFATETVSRDTRPRCLSVHACRFDHPRPLSDKLNNKSMADRDGTDERTHTLSHAMCR